MVSSPGRSRSRRDSDVEAVVVMRMGHANARHHVLPICSAAAPATVVIVRPSDQPAADFGPNAVVIDTRSSARWLEVLLTLVVGLRVTLARRPRRIMSFNALPYGIMASWIGLVTRTPVHVGFVGTDANRVGRRPWVLRLLATTWLVTTTGEAMTDHLHRLGLRRRTAVLPHGVDGSRFTVDQAAERDIDVLFVGGLVPVKRIDLLLRGLATARGSSGPATAAVVGDGPEAAALHGLADELGIATRTTFVGYDPRPERWLLRARLLVMTSQWEGLPFAVVEAMRCGAVPVATDVGSVAELVEDGVTGRLLPPDPTPEQVAATITDLLRDGDTMHELREHALCATSSLTYEAVAEWWADTFTSHV